MNPSFCLHFFIHIEEAFIGGIDGKQVDVIYLPSQRIQQPRAAVYNLEINLCHNAHDDSDLENESDCILPTESIEEERACHINTNTLPLLDECLAFPRTPSGLDLRSVNDGELYS